MPSMFGALGGQLSSGRAGLWHNLPIPAVPKDASAACRRWRLQYPETWHTARRAVACGSEIGQGRFTRC